MREIRIKVGDKEYILNDNSGKYQRAVVEAGKNASPDKILAIYDRLGGLIEDEQGNQLENGPFWKAYQRWEEERPKYIKILSDRDRSLEEGEQQTIGLILKNIDHKRAFLGTLMTIAAGIMAGLFIVLTGKDFEGDCIKTLAVFAGFGFALFIVSSSIYLLAILSQESASLEKHLHFVRSSRKDFIAKIGHEIVDVDSYEKYRAGKYKEEHALKVNIKGAGEFWFVLVVILFVASSLLTFVVFWLAL